jgi:outer membrane murein-binding lipoprotein Lpp
MKKLLLFGIACSLLTACASPSKQNNRATNAATASVICSALTRDSASCISGALQGATGTSQQLEQQRLESLERENRRLRAEQDDLERKNRAAREEKRNLERESFNMKRDNRLR